MAVLLVSLVVHESAKFEYFVLCVCVQENDYEVITEHYYFLSEVPKKGSEFVNHAILTLLNYGKNKAESLYATSTSGPMAVLETSRVGMSFLTEPCSGCL